VQRIRVWWKSAKERIWQHLAELAGIAGSVAGETVATRLEDSIAAAVADALRKHPMTPTSTYVAGIITLTNANQAYNIYQLIVAQLDANCPQAARQFNLYAAHANTAQILVGSGALTSANYAYVLNADDMREYESDYQNIIMGKLFALSGSAGMKLGVEVMVM
jgi:hypothetical protein